MKKRRLIIVLLLFLLLMPFSVSAISDKYEDKIYDITGKTVESDKINLYLFHGAECPTVRRKETGLKK